MSFNASAPQKVHAESHKVLTFIRRIVHAVDTHSKRVEKTIGLTTPQLVLLMAIYELGEVTASRLSSHISLSLATVSTILDKLEARGVVERYRSVKDRRVVHARLTVRGQSAVDAAPTLMDELFLQRFATLPADRQQAVLAALENVADMMLPGDNSLPGGNGLMVLDLQGLKCPLPVLRTRKALGKAASGALLKVLCTDPMSAVDVPHLVRESGDALEEQSCESGVYCYLIRKRT